MIIIITPFKSLPASDCLKVCDDIDIFKTLSVEMVVETGNRQWATKKNYTTLFIFSGFQLTSPRALG
jgi:hypothetical protein